MRSRGARLGGLPRPGRRRRKRSAVLALVGELRPGDEAAGLVLAEARTIINEYGKGVPWGPGQDLGAIATAETKLGWFDQAVATVQSMLKEDRDGVPIDPTRPLPPGAFLNQTRFQQALAFVEIAEREPRRATARSDGRRAIGVVDTITEEGMRPYPLSRACVLLAQNGDVAGAVRETMTIRLSQRAGPLRAIEAEQKKAGDDAGALS